MKGIKYNAETVTPGFEKSGCGISFSLVGVTTGGLSVCDEKLSLVFSWYLLVSIEKRIYINTIVRDTVTHLVLRILVVEYLFLW